MIYVSGETSCRAPADAAADRVLCGSAFTPPKKINVSNDACIALVAEDCGVATDVSDQAIHGLDLSGKPNYVSSPANCHVSGEECDDVAQGVYNATDDTCDLPTDQASCA